MDTGEEKGVYWIRGEDKGVNILDKGEGEGIYWIRRRVRRWEYIE